MPIYYPQAAAHLRLLFEDYILSSDATKKELYPIKVVPRTCTVSVNDKKTSDKFTLELEYKDFPFDPRAIRAMSCDIFMQNMKSLQDDKGNYARISPNNATELRYTDKHTGNTIIRPSGNCVFSGFADESTIELDDSKRIMSVEGRDFSALLIDQPYADARPLDESVPIDQSFQRFLSAIPATKNIQVVNVSRFSSTKELAQQYNNPFGSLPNLGKDMPNQGAALSTLRATGRKESYWDIMQYKCMLAGLRCYFKLNYLYIDNPHNKEDENEDIRFVYGKNIKNFTLKRKLGRVKNLNVEVRSFNGKQIVGPVRIPRDASNEWCTKWNIPKKDMYVPIILANGQTLGSETSTTGAQPGQSTGTTDASGVGTQPAPTYSFLADNITTQSALVAIGQSIFEEYAFQQLEGSFETHDMVGYTVTQKDGSQKNFDLTQLSQSHPISIGVDAEDLRDPSMASAEKAFNFLKSQGYDPKTAHMLSQTIGQKSPRFIVKGYSMTFDQTNGFKIKVDILNIIGLGHVGVIGETMG